MIERVYDHERAVPEHLQKVAELGFIEFEGDTIYFCDPVYGERIQQGEIPRSLREDAMFCEGTEALQRLTHKGVLFKIAFNYHRGEVDVGPLLETAAWLEECEVAGMEWNSAPGHAMPKNRNEIRLANIPPDDQKLGRYVSLIVEHLNQRGVSVVPCDVDMPTTKNPEDDKLRTRLKELLSLVDPVVEKESTGQDISLEEYELCHLVWSAYQHIRQYLFIAHLGYMASQFEDQLQLGDTIGLVIGSGHMAGVPQKMEKLDVPLAGSTLVYAGEDSPIQELMFRKAVPDGEISRHGLRKIAEYRKQGGPW